MTCEQWRELIEEESGGGSLSAELNAHLDFCEECRKYDEEIKVALNALSVVDPGIVSTDAERFLAETNGKIDSHSPSTTNKQVWPKFLVAAAAVFFIIGSLVTIDKYSTSDGSVSSTGVNDLDLFGDLWNDGESNLDDESMDLLLSEIAPSNRQGVEEVILEGLSDDDLEYLERNFRVGDML